MTAFRTAALAVLTLLLAAGTAAAQLTRIDPASGPRAISGIPSSARHCVSGSASNVHPIGWLEAGSRFAITFDGDGAPGVASVVILDLDGDAAAAAHGTGDMRFSTSMAGTMALYVGGNNQTICYRYKVEIEPPAASTAVRPAARQNTALPPAKLSKLQASPSAISGLASSGRHCVAGRYVSHVHDLGYMQQGTQVRVTFASDFDPVAGVIGGNPQAQTATYLIDDDSGGNLEPVLHFSTSQPGTVALFVAGFNGAVGCYGYKVEITPPVGGGPVPGGVALSGIVTAAGSGLPISGATVRILDGANTGRSVSTTASGSYRFDGLATGNANVSAGANGYQETRLGTFINGTNTLNFSLPTGGPRSSFGAGQHRVGTDIAAGRYFADPASGCYWERQSGFGGTLGEILANDFVGFDAGQIVVDVLASDRGFETDSQCGTWFNTARHGFQSSVRAGTWLVGQQLAPGTYETNASAGCYWERLRGFSGELNQILANDFVASGGRQLVTISAGDAGFSADAQCGTWTRVSGSTAPSAYGRRQSPSDIERMRALYRDGDVRQRRLK